MDMKKYLLALALMLVTFVAVPVRAQFRIGLKCGANTSKISLDDVKYVVTESDNRTGFFVGLNSEFTLPIVGLGIDVSVLYDQKSVQVEGPESVENENLHYIDVPVNAMYSLGFGSVASIFATTGPQFSYNVGGKNIFKEFETGGYKSDFELKKSEFSWNVGGGVKLLDHLKVSYNYNILIGHTADISWRDAEDKIRNGNLRNNTHQLSVAYLF